MKLLMTLLLALISTVSVAATYLTELPDDMRVGPWVKIDPQGPRRGAPPTYMRFMVDPFHDSATATLEIVLSSPNTEPNGTAGYRLRRDGVDFVAENYIRHDGRRIVLDLPALKADEEVEFFVGWRDSPFPYDKVTARITTEHGTKTASWDNSDTTKLFPPGR